MFEAVSRSIDRAAAPLPGHMLVLSGMALLGLALLVPAWMESREMAWRVGVMKLQAERLREQEKGYREFHAALEADDPVLIERLAFYHLRLKPAGSDTLDGKVAARQSGNPRVAHAAVSVRTPTIEQMLHKNVPQPGVDMPEYHPLRTRLIRLTTGPMRLGIIAAGMLCLYAGITSPVPGLAARAGRRAKRGSRPAAFETSYLG